MVNDNIVIIQQRTGFTWKLSEAHVFCKIILLEEIFCQYSLKRGVPSATAGAAPAESRGVLSAQDAPGSDLDHLSRSKGKGDSRSISSGDCSKHNPRAVLLKRGTETSS